LTAGQSQTVTVRYSPTSVDTHSGTVTFTGGGGASRSVTGSAYTPSGISVTPGNLNFGSIQVNTTADLPFTVQNSGGGTLSGTATVAAPFSIVSGGSYTLTAGQSQTVTLRYSPTSVGTHNGTVNFTGGGGTNRSVTGTAYAAPGISMTPDSLNFGSIQVNTTADLNFILANAGGGTLSGTANVSAPFSIVSGGTYSLTAGQSQTVTVRYSPTSIGTHNGTVTFTGGPGASGPVIGNAYSQAGMVITTNPSGLTIDVDGKSYTAPQNYTWVAGSSHTVSTTSPQGSGGTRYVFANWSDGGAISHTIAVPASPTTYTANFTTQYQLTTAVSSVCGGTIGVNPASSDGFYSNGAVVQLTAIPVANCPFVSWRGDLAGQRNPQSVTMAWPKSVTASFAPTTPKMTLVPGSLSFGYQLGSEVQAGQGIEVKSSGAVLEFNVSVKTDSGGNWLRVTPGSGVTPLSLVARVNPEGLAAGNYTGKVTVSSTGAWNSPQTVEVSLTVSGVMKPKPMITEISPKGVVAGGTGFDLQVYGKDFVSGSKVRWDGVDLEWETLLSSQQLRVPVPANLIASAKVVKVTVYTPEPGGGESGVMSFNVSKPAPMVTGLSLQSVIAGRSGYEVGIYGANFLPESIAEWNGSGRVTNFVNSGQLTITLPAGDITQAGTGRITVMNPGVVRSNEKTLEVVALPVGSPEIQRLVPDTVDAGGAGFTLVVDGSGYVPGSTVEWNGQGKVTKYGSGGQLSAEIPASDIARAAESYSVVVRNPVSGASAQSLWPKDTGSGGSNAGVVSKRNPGPEVTGLSPAAVVAGSGGLQLRIIGGGYVEGKSVVGWNDVGLASSYVSSTELSVNIPAGYVATEGTATIEVRNPSPGGGAMAKTLTILPSAEAKAVLMYPRLMSVGGEADATESTGIAVANLSARAVKLTAWAYGKGGEEIRGEQITNPVSVTMSGEEQQAIIDWQVFGEKLREAGRGEGWLKLESTEKQVAGFFMMFNDSLTFLDGANASATGMQEFVLPEVADRGETEVYVANPNGESANVTFELRKEDGQQRGGAVQRQASGRGTLAVLLKDLFSGVAAEGGDYVRAVSDRKVVTLEYMGEKPKYVYALSGQEVVGGSRVLYGPQYVVGEQWRTTISVVNVDGASGTVTFRLINDEGMQIGEAKAVAIRGYGKVQVTDQDFFIGGDKSGYVEVRSDGPRLTGAIVFGDPERETMATSLPLTTALMNTMVFGHVVSNETWWTGITLINPGVEDASVTVELYDRMGTLVRSKQERIAAGCRLIGLLSRYFEGVMEEGFQQGYMKVTSDQGLAGFAIFGTNELSVISAIPPQDVPAE
jgi:hypothetical protein